MKLSNLFPQIKADKIQVKKAQGAASVKGPDAGAAVGADRVDLSASSLDMQKIKDILAETPAVRTEKVQSLKEQIERGEYEVDPHEVADRMLWSLISDNMTED